MSLLTAIAAASIFAFFGFPFKYYQCWFSFSPGATLGGTLLYLTLAGGGGGALGWLVATIGNADPTGSAATNGALYGIGGALALRADFRASPKSSPAPTDQFKAARSALASAVQWAAGMLDEIAARRAEAWLRGLDSKELVEDAYRIQEHISVRPGLSDKAKEGIRSGLVVAMKKMADPNERGEAREHIVFFCSRYYVKEHLARTQR